MTEQDFWSQLEETPKDWDLRRVFADWLEEHGLEQLAAGQRWQAVNEKHTRPTFGGKRQSWYKESVWIDKADSDGSRDCPESDIDDDVFDALASSNTIWCDSDEKQYASCEEAEETLAAVLPLLSGASQG